MNEMGDITERTDIEEISVRKIKLPVNKKEKRRDGRNHKRKTIGNLQFENGGPPRVGLPVWKNGAEGDKDHQNKGDKKRGSKKAVKEVHAPNEVQIVGKNRDSRNSNHEVDRLASILNRVKNASKSLPPN